MVDPSEVDWGYVPETPMVARLLDGWVADDGNAEVEYPDADSGAEAAREYVDDGDWGERDTTSHITVYAWRRAVGVLANGDVIEGTYDRDSFTVELEPPEPGCTAAEHAWESPHSVVGGLEENPGVHGHGGGVYLTQVCAHCGRYRVTDTWATNPETGEQGLESVSYRDADDASLAWIADRR